VYISSLYTGKFQVSFCDLHSDIHMKQNVFMFQRSLTCDLFVFFLRRNKIREEESEWSTASACCGDALHGRRANDVMSEGNQQPERKALLSLWRASVRTCYTEHKTTTSSPQAFNKINRFCKVSEHLFIYWIVLLVWTAATFRSPVAVTGRTVTSWLSLVQWYSTGGARRHLRGYIKFKISIYILLHEWSELHYFGFNLF
jgi:hypothetical protein